MSKIQMCNFDKHKKLSPYLTRGLSFNIKGKYEEEIGFYFFVGPDFGLPQSRISRKNPKLHLTQDLQHSIYQITTHQLVP